MSDWKEKPWVQTLAQVAPVLATGLGGPMAGLAVRVATRALGTSSGDMGTDRKALEEAVVSGNPDALLKLRQAEQDFLLQIERLGIERERLAGEDRRSARELAEKVGIRPQMVLATVFIFGFMLISYVVFTGEIAMTDKQDTMATMLLGILAAGITQIMNFFFGSSVGSKEKTTTLMRKG